MEKPKIFSNSSWNTTGVGLELLVSVSRTSDLSQEEKQKHQLSLEQSLI